MEEVFSKDFHVNWNSKPRRQWDSAGGRLAVFGEGHQNIFDIFEKLKSQKVSVQIFFLNFGLKVMNFEKRDFENLLVWTFIKDQIYMMSRKFKNAKNEFDRVNFLWNSASFSCFFFMSSLSQKIGHQRNIELAVSAIVLL